MEAWPIVWLTAARSSRDTQVAERVSIAGRRPHSLSVIDRWSPYISQAEKSEQEHRGEDRGVRLTFDGFLTRGYCAIY